MKKLYLIRHAKSSWAEPMMSDADRPLNKRGKKDAPLMAKLLSEKDVCPDYMVSSPAKRALKTAQIIADSLHYPEEKIKIEPAIYEGDMTGLLHLINQMRDTLHDIFLIGHNPAITLLANYLTKTVIDNIATCGIVCIAFNLHSWSLVDKGTGTLVFYEYPKEV